MYIVIIIYPIKPVHHTKRSYRHTKLGLKRSVYMGLFYDAFMTFVDIQSFGFLSMEGQITLGFLYKYLYLWFKDELKSYGFEM